MIAVLLAGLATAPVARADAAAPATRPAGPVTLRVLTYNLHHGATAKDVPSLDRQAKVIRDADPDLVALQELDRNTARTGKVDQLARLAELTGLRHAAFGRAMDFGGGEYGNGVLSKHPIASTAVHALPGKPKEEPRCALVATVTLPGGQAVTLAATHLNHRDADERLAQTKRLVELLAPAGKEAGPTILAGDFNAVPDSAAVAALRPAFRHAWAADDGGAATKPDARPAPTSPADNPRSTIDYVWVAPPARWRVREVRVIDEPEASDHRPVLVVLELVGGP